MASSHGLDCVHRSTHDFEPSNLQLGKHPHSPLVADVRTCSLDAVWSFAAGCAVAHLARPCGSLPPDDPSCLRELSAGHAAARNGTIALVAERSFGRIRTR